MSFQLPAPGDIQGQIQAGQNLAQQIEQASGPGGDPSALLEAGIAIAGSSIGGGAGVAVSTVGGILAGAAMAGPMGAAIAFVGSVAAILSQAFSGGSTAQANGVSKATATISNRIQSYGTPVGLGPNVGEPGGWSAADWSAFARPPSKTKNQSKLFSMVRNALTFYQYTNPGAIGEEAQLFFGIDNLPDSLNGENPNSFASKQVPLCTPIWFNWNNPSLIANCDRDLKFGSGGAGGSVATLKNRWIQGTKPLPGLSQSQIVANAIRNLPDPLYWSSSLYGWVWPSGWEGSDYDTAYFNIDLLNAMASTLNMLSRGASLQAVISELLIQSYILSMQGSEDLTGKPISHVSDNQYGFHQFVDDYLVMGRAQQQTATSPDLSTGAKVGAVLAGVTGAVLVGILGYSAVTKTSPVQTTRLALARAGQLRRRF
jgi:hypothetical protein